MLEKLRTTEFRILYGLILLLLIIIAPFWVSLILAGAGIVLFKDFYEGIAVGLIIDLLYAGSVGYHAFPKAMIYTTVILGLFIVVQFLRPRIYIPRRI